MAKENELIIKINGNVKGYQDALKKAAKETENLQQTFNSIAKTGAIAFAGFVGTIALTTTLFAKFENGLLGVKTLLDENSFSTKTLEEGFQDLSKGAIEALKEFPLALDSINKSLFDIVSAGIPASDAIDVLGSTSRLAVAGLTSSAVATDAVTTALNAYGISADQAELVSAKFFTAQKFGKTTIQELSRFMGEAVASASSFGVSLDELLASTAAATVGGIKTSQAFTSMTAVLANIAAPSEKATKEAERLGIEFTSTALRSKGLTKFLEELTTAENFNQQSVEKLFASTEAAKLIFSLTGAGALKYKQTLEELSDSQKVLTTFTRAYEEQSESLQNQTKILTNNFQALSIAIGAELAPFVSTLAKTMTSFLQFLQESPGISSFIAKILIVGTVVSGLAVGVGIAGIAFVKLRTAIIASTLAAKTFKIAVKSLLASTGLGLLIAFLPELIELFEKVFGQSTDAVENAAADQKKILLQQAKDEKEILEGKFKGLEEQQLDFFRRRQEIRKRIRELDKTEDGEAKTVLLANIDLLNKQLIKDQEAFAKKKLKVKTTEIKKGFDRDRQGFIDSNVLLTAHNAGLEKEQVAFLKRGQAINLKERAAEAIKDKINKELALKNVKLLREELIKDQKDLVTKQKEISDKKDADDKDKADKKAKRDADIEAKEEERSTKNIQRLTNETEIIKAKLDKQTADEISFLTRNQEVRDEAAEALLIKDDEERVAAIEKNDAQKALLLQQEQKFIADRTQLKADQAEIEAVLKAELDQLSIEQRESLNEEDLQSLRDSLQTKSDIEAEAAKQRLLANRKEKALFAADEKKFGGTIATINKFFRSENVKNAQKAASELIVLQQSSNSAMKAIGKAAALVQIAIDTQRGAMAAFTALAGIPIVGPGLGAAAAASLVLFGAERAAKVASAQRGGIVGGTGFGDTQPFLLEPNELIVPRQNFEETITAVSNQRAVQSEAEEGINEGETEGGVNEIIIGFTEEAADFLTVQQNEARALGISEEVR